MNLHTVCVKCGGVICLQERCDYPACLSSCSRLQVNGKDFDACDPCLKKIVEDHKKGNGNVQKQALS